MKQLPTGTMDPTHSETKIPMFSKLRVIKNLIVISGSCLLTFTSHDGLMVLQSTMNREKGIGVISLATQYAFGCLSALLLPKYLLKKFGCKAVLVVSMITFFPFIASNFYPHWILMIPASVLLGVGYSLLWSCHCAYLNCISNVYADHIQLKSTSTPNECDIQNFGEVFKAFPESHENGVCTINGTNESSSQPDLPIRKDVSNTGAKKERGHVNAVESTTALFFGFHAMMYQLCYVTSNLISYYVFKSDSVKSGAYGGNSTCSCGAAYCNVDTECSEHNLAQPTDVTKYILLSIFAILSVLSVIVVLMFLDSLKVSDEGSVKLSLDLLLATCRRVKERNQFLLIPLSVYVGMAQGFYIGDFTKSYVGCAWGMQNIGIVTVCCGIGMAISSPTSGWLIKQFGRVPVFLAMLLMDITVILILLLWEPDSSRPYMFFIASGIWGCLFGILWAQLRAFYGVLFKKDEEAAFGSYQLWHSVGTCLSLSYSNYICTYVKVYILLAVSLLGFIGYFIVERSHSISNKTKPLDIK